MHTYVHVFLLPLADYFFRLCAAIGETPLRGVKCGIRVGTQNSSFTWPFPLNSTANEWGIYIFYFAALVSAYNNTKQTTNRRTCMHVHASWTQRGEEGGKFSSRCVLFDQRLL